MTSVIELSLLIIASDNCYMNLVHKFELIFYTSDFVTTTIKYCLLIHLELLLINQVVLILSR
jgi:hypothetical protein